MARVWLGNVAVMQSSEDVTAIIMVEISANKEVSAYLDMVWNIVSDADSEPQYWQNLTVGSVRENGKVLEREIAVVFSDLKVDQTTGPCSGKLIEVSLTEWSAIGTRIIVLRPAGYNKTRIEVAWNIKLADIPLLLRGTVRKHVVEGTEEALDRIARAVQ